MGKESASEHERRPPSRSGVYQCRDCGADILFLAYTKKTGERGKMPCNVSRVALDALARGEDFRWGLAGVESHYRTCTAPVYVKWREEGERRRQERREGGRGR